MKELETKSFTIFENPEFGSIRTIELDGEPWMVGKDVAIALGYKNPQEAIRTHVDDEDKGVSEILTPGGKQSAPIINESGLYSLVLSSKLPTAKKFKRWVTKEVLPSIRKTGGYNMPIDYPSALRALADQVEKNHKLESEVQNQQKLLESFEPIKQYVDTILESKDSLAVTQIAKDYGMSAKQLNKILTEEGVQYKVNKQWVLYSKYAGKGYTDSKTYSFTHSNGETGTRIGTCWTQKGRLLIHELLQRRGIEALMDRKDT